MKNNGVTELLTQLVEEINGLYGYSSIPDFEGPCINLGSCGVFAYEFYKAWNDLFEDKIHIVFIMDTKTRIVGVL
ncbi:MAG: hypothetical protein AB8G05_08400 [Oligoflexales bacterium]